MALLNFNANNHEPSSSDFEPLPAGTYLACVVSSEMRPTKAGNGSYLQLELEVLDGQYKGRRLWDRLTLDHPNAVAVQIAQGKLSALCRAVGVLTPQDSAELHNRPVAVRVKCRKREDNGEMANEVAAFLPRDQMRPASVQTGPGGASAVAPQPASTAPASASAGGSTQAPWKRG